MTKKDKWGESTVKPEEVKEALSAATEEENKEAESGATGEGVEGALGALAKAVEQA